MSDTPDEDERSVEATGAAEAHTRALDHAWAWFKCHADQRIALFRFYVLVMGGLAGALGLLHQQKENLLCAVLAIFSAFASLCFVRLDKRTSDLVRLGEAAMKSEQARLSVSTGNDDFNIAKKADGLTGAWPYTYREVIRALLVASMGLFVLFALISVMQTELVVVILRNWICDTVSR